MEEKNLPVPYRSQFDQEASEDQKDDCGPSSIGMILAYYGEQYSTNEIFERTGATAGSLISIAQLQQAISTYGFTSDYRVSQTQGQLKALIDAKNPPIVLVKAQYLKSKQDTFSGGHLLVVVGYRKDGVFCNDPDFWGQYRADGDHHFYTWEEFLSAWGACHEDDNPDNSLLVIEPKNPLPQDTTNTDPTYVEQLEIDRKKFWEERDVALTKAQTLQAELDTANGKLTAFQALGYNTIDDVNTKIKGLQDTIDGQQIELTQVLNSNATLAGELKKKNEEDSTAVDTGMKAQNRVKQLEEQLSTIAQAHGTDPNPMNILLSLDNLQRLVSWYEKIVDKLKKRPAIQGQTQTTDIPVPSKNGFKFLMAIFGINLCIIIAFVFIFAVR